MAHRKNRLNSVRTGWAFAFLLMVLPLVPVQATAQEAVGRVLVAAGGVTAKQEGVSARGLGRNDPIYTGDTIRTGSRGRIQIRFRDGGLVDLKPSTRFAVDSYGAEEDDGNVVLRFLRGAMRTITGAIGAREEESYRMETPVATIGVRGTAYALHYCDEACAAEGGDEGLYGRVDEGRIVARNPGGEAEFASGSFFAVEPGGTPTRIVAPPTGVLDASGEAAADGESAADGGDGGGGTVAGVSVDTSAADTMVSPDAEARGRASLTEAGFEAADEVDEIDERGPDDGGSGGDGGTGGGDGGAGDGSDVIDEFPTTGDIVFAGALDAAGETGAFVLPTMSDATSSFVGGVVPEQFDTLEGAEPTVAESGATTIADDSGEFQLQWARWSIPTDSDQDGISDGTGRLAFAVADSANLTPESSLTSGNASYGLARGPLALGSAGGVWGFEVIGIDANFTEGVASLQDFSLFERNGGGFISLDATTTGTIEASTSTVEFSDFALSGDGTYNGNANGVFVGEGGEALVIGFRLDESGGSHSISGVQVIE